MARASLILHSHRNKRKYNDLKQMSTLGENKENVAGTSSSVRQEKTCNSLQKPASASTLALFNPQLKLDLQQSRSFAVPPNKEPAGTKDKKAVPPVTSSTSSKPRCSLTILQKKQVGRIFHRYILKGWIPSVRDIKNTLAAHNLQIDKTPFNIRTWVKAEIERNKKMKGGKVERSQWSSSQIKSLREHFLKYYKLTKQRRKPTFPSKSEYTEALATIEEFRGKNIEFLRGKLRYEFKLLLSESGGKEANNIRAAMGDTPASRWNIFQKKKVREHFRNYYIITKMTKIPKYPTAVEIYKAIEKLRALKDKSVTHVRSMLYFELKSLVNTRSNKVQSKLKKARPKVNAWSQIEKNSMRAHFRHYYEIAMKIHAPIYPFRFEVQMAVQTVNELGRKSPNQVRDRLQNELMLLMQYLKT